MGSRNWQVHVPVGVVLWLEHDDLGAGKLETGIDGDVRVGLDEDFLFSEAERNDLVADRGTILQEEGKLRPKGLVVDFAQVAEAGSFKVQALDVVHRQPTPVYLLHSVLGD